MALIGWRANWLAGLLRLLHLRQRNYIFYLRTATLDASAAPCFLTAAVASRNSRFKEFLRFAVAAVKTGLQDFFASHPLVASHPLGERFLVLKPQR